MSGKRTGAMLGAATLAISGIGLLEDTSRRTVQAQIDRTIFNARHRWRRRMNNVGVFALLCVGAGCALYAIKTNEDDEIDLTDRTAA